MNRQWLYAQQPKGKITPDTFQWRETAIPEPREGEALVQTRLLSLDPANRAWMMGKTYRDALEPGQVMSGFAIGEVVDSKAPGLAKGDIVEGDWGWQDYAALPARRLTKRTTKAPLELLIGPLSVTGLTAYFGLLEVGRPKPGDTVLVSAAAGAVGSMAGQIARIAGCRVVGTAGGKAKCDWLTSELGFDAAVDYKSEDVPARLKELCPKGIDIFFDNVGGDILDAALARLAMRGRVVLCGGIANYNATEPPPGPKNYLNLVVQRGRMEGFIVLDYMPRAAEAVSALAGWVQAGKLKNKVDVQRGLENAPATLRRLFEGRNEGKQLLRIAE
jgi:NADPH-dependent curcumin reductase CurA